MVKKENICRLCGHNNLSLTLSLPHSPGNISRVLRKDEIGMIPSINLQIYECTRCSFVQLIQKLDETFYDDYLMTSSHSLQMQRYQKELADDYLTRYNLKNKRIVDVGCGDGAFMGYLLQDGATVAGIEPSICFREEAMRDGFLVFPGYVSVNSLIPERPYDGFVTRQVLEHVHSLHDFLQGIRLSLSSSAVGLIEVPSLEQTIEKQRFYDFFPDHLNYFSKRTLSFLLEMNVFGVDKIYRGMSGEYNIAYVHVHQNAQLAGLQKNVKQIINDVNSFINSEKKEGRRKER